MPESKKDHTGSSVVIVDAYQWTLGNLGYVIGHIISGKDKNSVREVLNSGSVS